MTLTDDQKRDRIDAAADTLDDIGMPTLAHRLRETADELLPSPTARTLGQVAFEAMLPESLIFPWEDVAITEQAQWESAAAAVIAHHEQQPVWDERIEPTPSWSPVVGAWAEHRQDGRVLVLRHTPVNDEPWLCWSPDIGAVNWWPTADLSAPQPRVWESADEVPFHVGVQDAAGALWVGGDIHGRLTEDHGPYVELLPEGGVW